MKIAGIELLNLKRLAKSKRKKFEKTAKNLKQLKSSKIDDLINEKHQELFKEIDCLNCANCCKTTSPIILQKDIQRIAKHLNISASQFMKQYIIMDEDGDYIMNSTPCPFLNNDNSCSIYEARPKACQQYPHTQQRKQVKLLQLAIENTAICPAVYQIFEYLEEINE